MGDADGLAAGVTIKAGILILQRPLFYKSQLCSPLVTNSLGTHFPSRFFVGCGIEQRQNNQERLRIKWQHKRIIQLCK